MKARVYVMLKNGVLDPQGEAVRHALGSLGFDGVEGVRQGKVIELDLAEGTTEDQVKDRKTGEERENSREHVVKDRQQLQMLFVLVHGHTTSPNLSFGRNNIPATNIVVYFGSTDSTSSFIA